VSVPENQIFPVWKLMKGSVEEFIFTAYEIRILSEGAGISATTGQFKRVLRLYDCLMLHEHSLISAEPLEHKKGIYSGESRYD
jgi:hypothetical protein